MAKLFVLLFCFNIIIIGTINCVPFTLGEAGSTAFKAVNYVTANGPTVVQGAENATAVVLAYADKVKKENEELNKNPVVQALGSIIAGSDDE